MIKIKENKLLFTIERIWFENAVKKKDHSADIERYLRMFSVDTLKDSDGVYLVDCAHTLITRLQEKDDAGLLSDMKKTVQYEIKKCLKENIVINFYEYDDSEIWEIVRDFQSVYQNFCLLSDQRKIVKDYNLKKIKSYIDNKCILISRAEYKNGKVYHMYVWDKEYALLVFSASDFRNKEVDKNLAGRANKLLHYRDMLFFKERGVHIYDWGNVASFDTPNGIDTFKMSFGGEHKDVYNVFWGNTMLGKTLIKIRKYILR